MTLCVAAIGTRPQFAKLFSIVLMVTVNFLRHACRNDLILFSNTLFAGLDFTEVILP